MVEIRVYGTVILSVVL